MVVVPVEGVMSRDHAGRQGGDAAAAGTHGESFIAFFGNLGPTWSPDRRGAHGGDDVGGAHESLT